VFFRAESCLPEALLGADMSFVGKFAQWVIIDEKLASFEFMEVYHYAAAPFLDVYLRA
jgi:hypothetical protein